MTGVEKTPLQLHDIVLPEPVSWMPQTAGWWVLLGVLLLLAVSGVLIGLRRRRRNAYRRAAMSRLDDIASELGDVARRRISLSRLPVLVKETALVAAPRAEVAGLSGSAWLAFLDESYGGRGFTEGPGRLLPTLAYATPEVTDALRLEELHELVDVVRRWIRGHRVRV